MVANRFAPASCASADRKTALAVVASTACARPIASASRAPVAPNRHVLALAAMIASAERIAIAGTAPAANHSLVRVPVATTASADQPASARNAFAASRPTVARLGAGAVANCQRAVANEPLEVDDCPALN